MEWRGRGGHFADLFMDRFPNGLTHDVALACSLSFNILAASVATPGSAELLFRFTPVSGSFCGVAEVAVADEVRDLTSQRGCVTEAGVLRDRRTLTVASGVTVALGVTSERRVFVTAG